MRYCHIEDNESIYITINHLDDFMPVMNLKVGDILVLKKEPENIYDDEAIAVYTKDNYKCGYVANSVYTVARGTYSAGRVYNIIEEICNCKIKFIFIEEYVLIAGICK